MQRIQRGHLSPRLKQWRLQLYCSLYYNLRTAQCSSRAWPSFRQNPVKDLQVCVLQINHWPSDLIIWTLIGMEVERLTLERQRDREQRLEEEKRRAKANYFKPIFPLCASWSHHRVCLAYLLGFPWLQKQVIGRSSAPFSLTHFSITANKPQGVQFLRLIMKKMERTNIMDG